MDDLKRALHLAKQTTFHCHLLIDSLVNVPFTTGTFSVRWRFKHAVPLAHEPAMQADHHNEPAGLWGVDSRATVKDNIKRQSHDGGETDEQVQTQHMPSKASEKHRKRPAHSDSFALDQFSPYSSYSGQTSAISRNNTSYTLTQSGPRRLRRSLNSSAGPGSPNPNDSQPPKRAERAEPRGETEQCELKAHTATFRRAVLCPVSIPLTRHSTLEFCSLKLTVRSNMHDELGKLVESKLGEVVIDLSEYAEHLKSNRRHPHEHKRTESRPETPKLRRLLLTDSKTNALLRVAIELDQVAGDDYIVLQEGETAGKKGKSKKGGVMTNPSANGTKASLNGTLSNESSSLASSSSDSVASFRSASSLPRFRQRGEYSASPAHAHLGLGGSTNDEDAAAVVESWFMVPLPSAQPAPSLRPAPSHISLRKSNHSSSSPLPSPSFLELPDSRRSSTYGLGPKDVDPRKTSRKKASFDSSQSDLPARSVPPSRPQRNDSYDSSLAPPTFASSFASIPLPPSNHQNDGKNVK